MSHKGANEVSKVASNRIQKWEICAVREGTYVNMEVTVKVDEINWLKRTGIRVLIRY